jgi:hypothetical protein
MPTGPFVTGVAAVDWVALAPVLVTAAGAVLVLGLDAVLGRSRGRAFAVLAAVALGSVLIAMASLVPLASGVRQTFCDPAGACGYVASHLTFALQVVILSGALVVLLLVLDEPDGPGAGRCPESLMLILAATSGACALAGARDLATLVVALETASLPVVGLVGLPGGRRAAEAATKLLLTTVTSFGLLSLGAALVYASTGSLHLRAPVAGALDLGRAWTPCRGSARTRKDYDFRLMRGRPAGASLLRWSGPFGGSGTLSEGTTDVFDDQEAPATHGAGGDHRGHGGGHRGRWGAPAGHGRTGRCRPGHGRPGGCGVACDGSNEPGGGPPGRPGADPGAGLAHLLRVRRVRDGQAAAGLRRPEGSHHPGRGAAGEGS